MKVEVEEREKKERAARARKAMFGGAGKQQGIRKSNALLSLVKTKQALVRFHKPKRANLSGLPSLLIRGPHIEPDAEVRQTKKIASWLLPLLNPSP